MFHILTSAGAETTSMIIMIGVDADGKISGTKCTEQAETPSSAAPVFDITESGYYVGQDSSSFAPHVVGGATMTSQAYANAVKAALDAAAILEGGN